MIIRSRSRLNGLMPHRFDPKVQDERTAQTVCFLSVLLVLPYFITKLEPNALLSSTGLAYSSLVLPMIVSANYNYPASALRSSLASFTDHLQRWLHNTHHRLQLVFGAIQRAEQIYARNSNITLLINQLVVFTLCDRFLLPNNQLTGLYSLMFYNVIAYCFNYGREVREMITESERHLSVRLSSRSSVRHLAISSTNCVLEWTRAVTITVTMVTMLLIFALKHELAHYGPTWSYICITGLYYTMTEKTFVQFFGPFLGMFRFQLFGDADELWEQAALKASTASIAAVVSLLGFKFGHWGLPLYSLYTCAYLRLKDLNSNELAAMRQYQILLGPFRFASQQELDNLDDVCAVCLYQMTTTMARVTPCRHVFHGECLHRCLLQSNLCPLCKRELLSQ